MNDKPASDTRFRVSELPQNKETRFSLRPGRAFCEALASELGLIGLRKLSFAGSIRAVGKSDWELGATLGVTVIQPCVVSLAPVTTRLDAPVQRRFLASLELPDAEDDSDEIEMPEDENAEALGKYIDVEQVMVESVALNLPLYPRTEDAKLEETVFTEPGKQAMKDEDTRPFAGLAGLRNKLAEEDKN